MEHPGTKLSEHFGGIEDPRIDRTKRHKLLEIIILAICGAICGADDWVAMEKFGKAKLGWFRSFLELAHGIPSHDTFGRVFGALDPEEFQRCFISWVEALSELLRGQVIAVDGKALRRSYDNADGKAAIYMVSAWAEQNHMVLGQLKVEEKSNEITAIPKLLRLLDLRGCIVTADAMGCQKEIAEVIVERQGAYVLAVKGNQGGLHQDVVSLFQEAERVGYRSLVHDHCRQINKGHGRIETRECWTISDPFYLDYLKDLRWKDLRCIIKVSAERRVGEERETQTRYYISSLAGNAKQVLRAVRGHWSIENSLHWVLDVAFNEDQSRVRKGNAAANLATLRQIALNLLSLEDTAHCGIHNKRLMAAWDEQYLLKVLAL
jgi:predicted transposase YbfD/YdcC